MEEIPFVLVYARNTYQQDMHVTPGHVMTKPLVTEVTYHIAHDWKEDQVTWDVGAEIEDYHSLRDVAQVIVQIEKEQSLTKMDIHSFKDILPELDDIVRDGAQIMLDTEIEKNGEETVYKQFSTYPRELTPQEKEELIKAIFDVRASSLESSYE